MQKFLIPFLVIIALIIPGAVLAQDELVIDSLQIDLWPEYDRPEMLVIYRIVMSSDVSFPVELSFRIPAEVAEPNAVAVQDSSGALLNSPYKRTIQGDWALITVTATMPKLQIEYYDPQLSKSGAMRDYDFIWQGDYQIENLFIQIQKPMDAGNLNIIGGEAVISQGADGFEYHTVEIGPLTAGEISNISLSYNKNSDSLSVEGFQVQPSAPISQSTSGRSNARDLLPWGLGFLGVIFLVGGIWWYWRLSQQQPQVKRSRRRKRSSKKTDLISDQGKDGGVSTYCHQCGKRTKSGDRFCRSCGSKLKKLG